MRKQMVRLREIHEQLTEQVRDLEACVEDTERHRETLRRLLATVEETSRVLRRELNLAQLHAADVARQIDGHPPMFLEALARERL